MSISVCLVTVPDLETARNISHRIIEQKYAACVNIVPQVSSIYRWKEKIEEQSELLLIIKTSSARVSQLETLVTEIHPYDTPEFIALASEKVSASYLKWVKDSVS